MRFGLIDFTHRREIHTGARLARAGSTLFAESLVHDEIFRINKNARTTETRLRLTAVGGFLRKVAVWFTALLWIAHVPSNTALDLFVALMHRVVRDIIK